MENLNSGVREIKGKFILNFSLFGAILVYDQLLLPMFHIGSFPYKVSYLLTGVWLFATNINSNNLFKSIDAKSQFIRFSLMIFGIMLCSVAGEILTVLLFGVKTLAETFKSLTIYILMILSFGLGLSSVKFSPRNLIWVLYTAVLLNLLFIFYKSSLPSFLIDLYYPPLVLTSWIDLGVTDVGALLELARPRGLFPNPNVSAFMVNIIGLFIYVSLKNKVLAIPNVPLSIGIIILPILVSILLASRGEMIAGFILPVLNYRILLKHISLKTKIVAFAFSFAIMFSIGIYALQKFDENGSITGSIDRVLSILEVLNQDKAESTYEARNQGVSRPLLMLDNAANRFVYSPLFGSGYTSGHNFPFDHPTQNYHNDWFRLIITSGIIGVILMLMIIRRYCLPLGYIVILPFILPGLVNTFLLNIPAVIFYFFMIGFLYRKVKIDRPIENKIEFL
jgi:hypothetical protein